MKHLLLLTACFAAAAAGFAQTPADHPESASFKALVDDAKTRVKQVNVDQLKAIEASGEKVTVIDVREDSEWAEGHAAGAVHMSKGVIERDIETKVPQKNAKLVLYCGGGARATLAADSLMKMGYTNVFSLTGGLKSYKAAGLPTEK